MDHTNCLQVAIKTHSLTLAFHRTDIHISFLSLALALTIHNKQQMRYFDWDGQVHLAKGKTGGQQGDPLEMLNEMK